MRIIKVLLFCVFCAAILAITSQLTKGISPICHIGAACIATTLLTVAFTGFSRERLSAIGVLPTVRFFAQTCIGFFFGLVLPAIQIAVLLLDGHATLWIAPNINGGAILTAFIFYFLAALREELAFRGYPLRTLSNAIGPMVAQIMIVVIFMTEHYAGGMKGWQAIVGPGVGAVMFGIAALRSRSIALPLGLHFAWNLGQWLFGLKGENSVIGITIEAGFENHVEGAGWLGYLIAMSVGITCVCQMNQREIQVSNPGDPRSDK